MPTQVASRASSPPGGVVALGSPCQDIHVPVVGDITFHTDWLEFTDLSGHRNAIPHETCADRDGRLAWGEKATAAFALGHLVNLPGATVVNGGGARNTIAWIADYIHAQHPPLQAALQPWLFSAGGCWPELDRELARGGIRGVFLGWEQAPVNAVLSGVTAARQAQRVILRSPAHPVPMGSDQEDLLRQTVPADVRALIINSPKSARVARLAADQALALGAAQCSVLSPSLPVDDRIHLLLERDALTVCNLNEFSKVTAALGVPCPTNEAEAPVDEVAEAMADVGLRVHVAGLIVTLGSRGAVVGSSCGPAHHVALRQPYWEQVQQALRRVPETINGIGDRYAAAAFMAFLFGGAAGEERLVSAALDASVSVVGQVVPAISRSAFDVRLCGKTRVQLAVPA